MFNRLEAEAGVLVLCLDVLAELVVRLGRGLRDRPGVGVESAAHLGQLGRLLDKARVGRLQETHVLVEVGGVVADRVLDGSGPLVVDGQLSRDVRVRLRELLEVHRRLVALLWLRRLRARHHALRLRLARSVRECTSSSRNRRRVH